MKKWGVNGFPALHVVTEIGYIMYIPSHTPGTNHLSNGIGLMYLPAQATLIRFGWVDAGIMDRLLNVAPQFFETYVSKFFQV